MYLGDGPDITVLSCAVGVAKRAGGVIRAGTNLAKASLAKFQARKIPSRLTQYFSIVTWYWQAFDYPMHTHPLLLTQLGSALAGRVGRQTPQPPAVNARGCRHRCLGRAFAGADRVGGSGGPASGGGTGSGNGRPCRDRDGNAGGGVHMPLLRAS